MQFMNMKRQRIHTFIHTVTISSTDFNGWWVIKFMGTVTSYFIHNVPTSVQIIVITNGNTAMGVLGTTTPSSWTPMYQLVAMYSTYRPKGTPNICIAMSWESIDIER